MLVFTWDGTGYGEDGTLWGGEGLFGSPGNWQRVSSFRPFGYRVETKRDENPGVVRWHYAGSKGENGLNALLKPVYLNRPGKNKSIARYPVQ